MERTEKCMNGKVLLQMYTEGTYANGAKISISPLIYTPTPTKCYFCAP